MMLQAAIALFALAAPAFAQHGGAHGGSFGGGSFAGRSGFSGHSGFSQSSSFARPAAPARSGATGRMVPGGIGSGRAGFRGPVPQSYLRPRTLSDGNRFPAARPSYDSLRAGASRNGDRGRDARRRSFANWYSSYYPNWLAYGYPYPYLIDPGFYDWGDGDGSENSAADESLAPYPDYGATDEPAGEMPRWRAPGEPTVSTAASESEELLTVIFKSGRAPVKMQNYMMTAKVLTDLDSRHYEQIPLDQIDVAATQRVNAVAGVEFQIPNASRD